MKKLLSLVFCILVGISVFAQKEDVNAIKNVYATYAEAMANKNAEEALRYVTASSVKYYTKLLTLSKTADSATLAAMPIVDILYTLSLWVRIDASLLCEMNSGEDLLSYSLRESKNNTENQIGDITVQGDTAYVDVENVPIPMEKQYQYRFVRESTGWKIDLTQQASVLSQQFEELMKQYHSSKQELYKFMMSMSHMPETTWEPACK